MIQLFRYRRGGNENSSNESESKEHYGTCRAMQEGLVTQEDNPEKAVLLYLDGSLESDQSLNTMTKSTRVSGKQYLINSVEK
jgi:hypothetical protein